MTIETSKIVDESGFVGCVHHTMDPKGRLSFPVKGLSWNGAAYPRETGVTPLTPTALHEQLRVYLFPPAALQRRLVSPSLGLLRHPVLIPDAMGRVCLPQGLRGIIGDARKKLFIGVGPYCILTNDNSGWETRINDLLLPDATLRELVQRKDAENGAVAEISQMVRGLVGDVPVDVALDLDISGVKIHGNLTFSRQSADTAP